MCHLRALVLPLTALAVASAAPRPAAAAPIAVEATLTLEILGIAPPIVLTGSGSVDVSGSTIHVPAGLIDVASQAVPVTSTTALFSIVAQSFANQSATFSLGGVTSQVPSELCTNTVANEACVGGGGIGGAMGLSGVLAVHVIEDTVVVPIDLDAHQVGQGGHIVTAFYAENGLWTTGSARLRSTPFGFTAPSTTVSGTNGGTQLTLVTTTYIIGGGNALPIVGSLRLATVPEPGAGWLVAAGVVAVASVARRPRLRRRG